MPFPGAEPRYERLLAKVWLDSARTASFGHIMVFRERGSQRPLLWAGPLGIMERTGARSGMDVVAFSGKDVVDPDSPVDALSASPSVELYEADLDQTQALMANALKGSPVLHEGLTYDRWAQAVLAGDCLSAWLCDLDLDHALGFSERPSYPRPAVVSTAGKR